jgi:hypothetical protein
MSDERFDRLENQLSQFMMAVDNRLTCIENRMGALERNQNASHGNVRALRNQIDSVGETVRITITDGFREQEDMQKLNAMAERLSQRLNQRVERSERLESEGN